MNLGGAIGPILALQVRENLGIAYVLVMSSITSLVLVVGDADLLQGAAAAGRRAAAELDGQGPAPTWCWSSATCAS